MKIIAIHPGSHDASFTAFEDGRVLKHLEAERLFKYKHFGWGNHREVSIDETIEYFVGSVGWSLNDVDGIAVPSVSGFHHWWWHSDLGAIFARHHLHAYGSLKSAAFQTEWRGKRRHFFTVLHHLSHLASAYYTSPYDDALTFAYDGVGEFNQYIGWGVGDGRYLRWEGSIVWPLKALGLKHPQVGTLFGVLGFMMPFLGVNVLQAPGKAMGLSSYGTPVDEWRPIVDHLLTTNVYNNSNKPLLDAIESTGIDPVEFSDPNSRAAQDFMATVQDECERQVCEILSLLVQKTGKRTLCLAGGCALNVQINNRLIVDGVVDRLYVPPCCNDGGLSLGAALFAWHHMLERPYEPQEWFNPYIGDELYGQHFLQDHDGLAKKYFSETGSLCRFVAKLLARDGIVGWARGRSEIGPRALGNRSILSSPIRAENKDKINANVKHREYWRPFAPVCLAEKYGEWFETDHEHPYMLESPQVRPEKRHLLQAVTHVDGSARLQTVRRDQNPDLHQLLVEFEKLTGVPVLLNTSLNDRGEPIANHVDSIFNLLRGTDLDYAVINNDVFSKKNRQTLIL